MHEMFSSLLQWYLGALDQGGYLLIALLMAMESSIIPLPSEFVIPPAAYLAHTNGTFSLSGIVIAGTVGSWVGASVMYWASYFLGRPLLMRYGRYVLITPEKIEKAEIWAAHYGTVGVFISRLLPVIRHLIGIPAGVCRLHFGWYSLATIVGSGHLVHGPGLGRRDRRSGRTAHAGQPASHHALGRRLARVPWRSLLFLRASPHAAMTCAH